MEPCEILPRGSRLSGKRVDGNAGFPLILNAWNEKHWVKPELVEQPELMQVKLTLYFENEARSDSKKGLNNSGVKGGVKEMSEVQNVIISEILKDPGVTTKELAQKTGVKFRTLQRHISQLKNLGVLARDGGRKDGRWVVVSDSTKTDE